MNTKRFESSLLTDTIIEEEKNRKIRHERAKMQAKIRRVNKLKLQSMELQVEVKRLELKKRKIEEEKQRLAVENAREEGRSEGRRFAMATVAKQPPPPIMYYPQPGVSTPSTPLYFFPLPSLPPLAYPSMPLPEPSVPKSIPKPACSTVNHTQTQHGPNSDTLKANPIKNLGQRNESYWRSLATEINQNDATGKRLFQNPADGYTFRYQKHANGVIKVYLSDTWCPIKGYNQQTF